MFFVYSIAGEFFTTQIVSKTSFSEETLCDVLWDFAPVRCNVCGVDEYETLEEVQLEVDTYCGEDFFIENMNSEWKPGEWNEVITRVGNLATV